MTPLAWKLVGGGVVVLLVGGLIAGYAEYREVADQVEPLRARWEAAKRSSQEKAERIAEMRAAWADSLVVLDMTRDSLQDARASAAEDTEGAIEASELVADSLRATLQAVQAQVRDGLAEALGVALQQLTSLEERHADERRGWRGQLEATEELLVQQERRTTHWRSVADSAFALAETRLQRALAAEEEREVWRAKAKWDVLSDGPQALLYAAGGIALWEGGKAVLD